MKKIFKAVLVVVLILFIGIVGLIMYVKIGLPNVGPAPEITIKRTEARIKRGEYLANAVSVCMDCHSTRDWTKFSGPLIPATLGGGGEVFDQNFGFPGVFYSKNITPYALGNWSDGEIVRAIAAGVSKNGKALFPVMPHPNYGKMDQEDIYSIVAYLRTLKPVENKIPLSQPDFPMNIIINTIPKPASFQPVPDKKDLALYGGYIFNAAACNECHTKSEKGEKIKGMELAGSFEFPMPAGVLRSTNITPDEETGIGSWSEAAFVNRFKAYADSSYTPPAVGPGAFNTIMPWLMYSKMTDEDLKAVYAYLRTVKPVRNEVVRFTPKGK